MAAIDTLRWYEFRDTHGHALEMTIPYQAMCEIVDAAVMLRDMYEQRSVAGTQAAMKTLVDVVSRHAGSASE